MKFGDVSQEELLMNNYAMDTLADAVILFDKGAVTLEPQSALGTTFKKHIRIKIFNQKAFDEWGNITIYASHGELSKLKGATYNLENIEI
jgi:hypothetical protein